MTLSKKEIEDFREILLMLRARLTNSVTSASEDVKSNDEMKGYSQHQADEGTDDFIRNVSLEVTGKEVEVLRQIDRALEKIDEGTYGICDLTDAEIPKKRLEAIPYATMTVAAQEKLEKGLIQ